MANSNTAKDKVLEWVFKHLDFVFSILRIIKPNVVFKGNAIITRYEDVTEVLERDWVFQVPERADQPGLQRERPRGGDPSGFDRGHPDHGVE